MDQYSVDMHLGVFSLYVSTVLIHYLTYHEFNFTLTGSGEFSCVAPTFKNSSHCFCCDSITTLASYNYPYSMGHCLTKSSEKQQEDDHFSMEGRNVTLITTINKWDEKLSEANRDSKIVVVNFSASWCSPCRVISPAFCDLADKYSSMMFLTVDVDELAEFSTSWDIKATPTFFFLKNGQEVDKFVGANKEELQRKTAAIAGSQTNSLS